jgi:hypothetical protein
MQIKILHVGLEDIFMLENVILDENVQQILYIRVPIILTNNLLAEPETSSLILKPATDHNPKLILSTSHPRK